MMPEEHIAVFYEGQDDLVDVLAASLCSICHNTASFVDFFILDCGISDVHKRMLERLKTRFSHFSLTYIPVDLKQFEGLKGWGDRNQFLDCYARLLFPDLRPDVHKAIYLDSDVMALGDIRELYDQDMEDFAIAAAPDLGCNGMIFDNCIRNLHVARDHVFANAGVVLVDCDRWRRDGIGGRLLQLAREYRDFLNIIIEELFCIYFNNNNYKRLDLRFCMSDRINDIRQVNAPFITDEYVADEWLHAVIQHITPTKMWKFLRNDRGGECRNFSLFWYFAKMTPYYEGMLARYMFITSEAVCNAYHHAVSRIMLLKIIPIYVIRKNNCIKYRLFNRITVWKEIY